MRRLVAIAVVAPVVFGCGEPGEQSSFLTPQEYTRRANAFIEEGYLKTHCYPPPVRLETRLEGASAEERAWYHDSYLRSDVERFNEDPDGYGWTFFIDENCNLTSVNPAVHTIRLPFAQDTPWLGTVYYGGHATEAILRSSSRDILIRTPTRVLSEQELGVTRIGVPDTVDSPGGVRIGLGNVHQPGADAFSAGGTVVLQSRTGKGPIRVMGHLLPESRILRLESGDWITLSDPWGSRSQETFVLTGERSLRAASRVRRRNEQIDRVTDDAGLGRLAGPTSEEAVPFLDLLPRSLNAALAVFPASRAAELRSSFDVQLTLDRTLHLQVDRQFREFVRETQRRQGIRAPITAGVTVMDGLTGHILALATFPHESDLAGMEPVSERTRQRLLFNQNFLRHPIGSAGKPFFFAAIADRHPSLLSFTVGSHSKEQRKRVFHCELSQGYEVHGTNGPVDLVRALEISSNRYTVELATLALAMTRGQRQPARDDGIRWPGPGSTPEAWVDGVPLGFAPNLRRFLTDPSPAGLADTQPCSRMSRLEQVPFAERFEAITGVYTYPGRQPGGPLAPGDGGIYQRYTTGRYDLRVWRPVLDHLLRGGEDQAWAVRAAFQGASPERVIPEFNKVSTFREDFITMLLGGGTSSWTNVQLAEATSRLVTDHAVEARMASAVLPREQARAGGLMVGPRNEPVPPMIGILPEVRRAVLSGMARVVEGNEGTATAMAPALRALRRRFPNDRIFVFAKTGTPRLLRTVSRAAAAPLEDLMRQGRIRFENGNLFVITRAGPVPYAYPGTRGRTELETALRGALQELRRNTRPIGDALLAAMDGFMDQMAQGEASAATGPFRVGLRGLELNLEDDFFRRGTVQTRGAVLVFSLVRIPGPGTALPEPADFTRPGTRVLSVTIHIAADSTSALAVDAAARLLPVLGEYLIGTRPGAAVAWGPNGDVRFPVP